MATRNILSESSSANIHSGSTIRDLEKLVERTILDARPPISLAQLRILLRVEQACEACEARGWTESRGDFSDSMNQDRCEVCRGKGYVIPEKEEVQ